MKKKRTGALNSQPSTINSLRPFSSLLLDGPERAAARAMLYPVGFTEADFKKPIIGIASTWSNVTPCNMHIDKLALEAEKGANELPLRFDRGEGRGEVSNSSASPSRTVSRWAAKSSPTPSKPSWAAAASNLNSLSASNGAIPSLLWGEGGRRPDEGRRTNCQPSRRG